MIFFKILIDCLKSCFSQLTSDCVSILGSKEVAGFRLGETWEAKAEGFFPPPFEVDDIFLPQAGQGIGPQGQCR